MNILQLNAMKNHNVGMKVTEFTGCRHEIKRILQVRRKLIHWHWSTHMRQTPGVVLFSLTGNGGQSQDTHVTEQTVTYMHLNINVMVYVVTHYGHQWPSLPPPSWVHTTE